MLEGSSESEDSENELLAYVIHQPAVNKGDCVLVKFAEKQQMSYDAGRVVRVDKREDEVQTTYMACTRATPSPSAVHKPKTWHDTTSRTSSQSWQSQQQLVTQLARPTN